MFYSPFVNHYKPKLQINISTQKWHCWVSNKGGYSIYSLFKKVNVNRELYTELKGIFFVPTKTNDSEKQEAVVLPKEFIPLWRSNRSLYRGHAIKFLRDRGFDNYDIKKYKIINHLIMKKHFFILIFILIFLTSCSSQAGAWGWYVIDPSTKGGYNNCLLYTSPSPRD